jgi:hypothetical protein
LKDRNKIRYLLALSGAPEEEVTYFRDKLDKRLIKVPKMIDANSKDINKQFDDQDLIIMEEEIQSLLLKVSACETQLNEQVILNSLISKESGL